MADLPPPRDWNVCINYNSSIQSLAINKENLIGSKILDNTLFFTKCWCSKSFGKLCKTFGKLSKEASGIFYEANSFLKFVERSQFNCCLSLRIISNDKTYLFGGYDQFNNFQIVPKSFSNVHIFWMFEIVQHWKRFPICLRAELNIAMRISIRVLVC